MTYTGTEPASLVTFSDTALTYSFYEATDLTLASLTGPNYMQSYALQVDGRTSFAAASVTVTLEVKNPCVDPAYNTISTPADFTVSHQVFTEALVVDYSSGFS